MPVVVPLERSEFLRDINGGGATVRALLKDERCPRCQGGLELTRSQVVRQAIGVEGSETLRVPLARCQGRCRGRFRVLPSDLLPGKVYSLEAVEAYARSYLHGSRGLRGAVSATETRATRPHFTTLHGWLGGLGERVLDRVHLGSQRARLGGKPRLAPFRRSPPGSRDPHRRADLPRLRAASRGGALEIPERPAPGRTRSRGALPGSSAAHPEAVPGPGTGFSPWARRSGAARVPRASPPVSLTKLPHADSTP